MPTAQDEEIEFKWRKSIGPLKADGNYKGYLYDKRYVTYREIRDVLNGNDWGLNRHPRRLQAFIYQQCRIRNELYAMKKHRKYTRERAKTLRACRGFFWWLEE